MPSCLPGLCNYDKSIVNVNQHAPIIGAVSHRRVDFQLIVTWTKKITPVCNLGRKCWGPIIMISLFAVDPSVMPVWIWESECHFVGNFDFDMVANAPVVDVKRVGERFAPCRCGQCVILAPSPCVVPAPRGFKAFYSKNQSHVIRIKD